MLEHLFGSRTRVRLLTLFLHNQEEVFFFCFLTRRIDTQINAVRRELQNLVDLGFVVEGEAKEEDSELKRPGLKRKYYRANKRFPLFRELHSLITKSRIFLDQKLDQRLRALGDVKYLAFLGVFLGVQKQPVDLFIVGTIDERGLKKLVGELEADLGSEINYTAMTPQDYAYRKEIADRFLDAIMLAPKNVAINELEK